MVENVKFAKPKELKHWAYETIKQIILDGHIAPGDQLRTDDLAKSMNISRTPIREALLRLESEGLVKANSRVGFFVTETAHSDFKELFELRELTEGYAAEKAAPLLSDEDLAQIDVEHQKAIAALEKNDLMQFNTCEIALHDFVIRHSRNQRLLKMVDGLKDLTYRERLYALRSRENLELSLAEHQRLIVALHARDGELAGRMMRDHLRNVYNRLRLFLNFSDEGHEKNQK